VLSLSGAGGEEPLLMRGAAPPGWWWWWWWWWCTSTVASGESWRAPCHAMPQCACPGRPAGWIICRSNLAGDSPDLWQISGV